MQVFGVVTIETRMKVATEVARIEVLCHCQSIQGQVHSV